MSKSVRDAVKPISLPPLEDWPEPLRRDRYVFLVDGPRPALVNGVHPQHVDRLRQGLQEHGYALEDIERVVYTSWHIEVLGSLFEMPWADHFVFSPDMIAPTDYRAYIQRQRHALEKIAEKLDEEKLKGGREAFQDFLDDYFSLPGERMDFIPIQGGHKLRVGPLSCEVLVKRGPSEGHICLLERDREMLFGGELVVSGMPNTVDDVQAYLVSLENLQELDASLLYSNFRGKLKRPSWQIGRTMRFMNNFLNHAPATMYNAPTVREFIENDRGRPVESFSRLVLLINKFKNPLDELERMGMIETDGSGLSKKYGVDVDDPRSRIRP